MSFLIEYVTKGGLSDERGTSYQSKTETKN